jgi:hypothetical protein
MSDATPDQARALRIAAIERIEHLNATREALWSEFVAALIAAPAGTYPDRLVAAAARYQGAIEAMRPHLRPAPESKANP